MIQIPNITSKAACFGCGACQAACPHRAITMVADGEGFVYPVLDAALCTECGLCSDVCPAAEKPVGLDSQAYALRCSEVSLLRESASGGAFSLLARQVLDRDGLVCGAVFDEGFRVKHVLSQDIGPMRKSKYVQSDLTGIHRQVLEALDEGKTVLFTGTPCQCHSMRRFAGENRENLILAAIICRGVQSPGLWADYTAFLAKNGTLEAYSFRDKRVKNNGHTVAYTVGGKETALSMGNDPFSRLYMKCLTLRPSCYQCPYTRWKLPFDLTIGDFWGVEKVFPELADGMGTSLVIARTEKGRALVESLGDSALVLPCSRESAQQPALNEPAKETMLRKLLFRDFARKNEEGVCDIPLILKKYGG